MQVGCKWSGSAGLRMGLLLMVGILAGLLGLHGWVVVEKWSGWDGSGPVPPGQDLLQHAGAGRVWHELEDKSALYDAGRMAEAIERLEPGSEYGSLVARGRYLYPPAVAWVAPGWRIGI